MTQLIKFVKLIGFLIFFIILSPVSIAAPVLFEDFSSSISQDKFKDAEQNIELDTTNENLILSQKGSAHFKLGESQFMIFANTNIEMLQADLSVTDLSLGNSSTQQTFVRLGGYFYKTAFGNIWSTLQLGDRGNGLEAWYEIFEEDFTSDIYNRISSAQGSLATGLSLNTAYTASIDFDGNNTFTFVFDGGSPVVAAGPARVTLPDSLFKFVGTRIRFGNKNDTQADFEDSSPDDGSPVSISVTIDNVITGATAPTIFDDFSAPTIDVSKWTTDEGSIEIVNNQLEMKTTNQTTGRTSRNLLSRKTDYKTVGATITMLSSSVVPAGPTRIRTGISHILGNDTFNEVNGDSFNGNENDIFTFIRLRAEGNGTFRAEIYASKVTSSNFSTEVQLFYQVLFPPVPVTFDQAYALEIEQTDTLVNYKIDGVTLFSFDPKDNSTYPALSGNLHPASDSAFTQFLTRVQNGPGAAHVRFDDIITNDENRNIVTRAEIAKPLLQAVYGKAYVPPVASGTLYSDVNAGDFNIDWIEKLAVDGITEGCDTGRFCPNMIVTKEQLSKLILKTKNSFSFMPPSPTGAIFDDISLASIDADWIEELANQAISAGCDANNFCRHEAATTATIEAMIDRPYSL